MSVFRAIAPTGPPIWVLVLAVSSSNIGVSLLSPAVPLIRQSFLATADQVQLDFSRARRAKGARSSDAHEGTFTALSGVRVVDTEMDIVIHTGGVDFVRDKLAEEFYCWWTGDGIPEAIWRQLDMGVQRRMVSAGHWASDPLVKEFS